MVMLSESKKTLEETQALYDRASACVKEINKEASRKEKLNTALLMRAAEKLVNDISSCDEKIIFITGRNYPGEYLLYHTLNVTILSIKMGLFLGYPAQLLADLGVLALLHGMNDLKGEGQSAQELEEQEFIEEFIRERQIREQVLGEALSIIAVIDVYESLTHSRPYRPRFTPFEVLKAIISAGEGVFDAKIVKEVIKVFSVYPLGSKVRLDSGEVAEVIRINRDFPLRPEVLIISDNQERELQDKKVFDLCLHPFRYIKEAIL
jgi:HD-GYP domain-containing protein (c-di-GMP phosphodiesterase class II)